MKTQTREIDLKKIVPDVNQPRKLFEPIKLKNLKDSIKKYGVMTPLTVEEVDGKYLLIDGERRYRAAKDLGIEKLPVVIIEPQNETERLVQQFHIQEQREEWTGVEKAVTVQRLSSELNVTVPQICELLSLDSLTAQRYVSFSKIIAKDKYHQSEIGINWVGAIIGVKNAAKKLTTDVLEKEFTKTDERKLEVTLIERIKEGQFERPTKLSRVKDIFTKSPKLIEDFANNKDSVDMLFTKSKARSAAYLRQMQTSSNYLVTVARGFLSKPDTKATPLQLKVFKTTIEVMNNVIKEIGDLSE